MSGLTRNVDRSSLVSTTSDLGIFLRLARAGLTGGAFIFCSVSSTAWLTSAGIIGAKTSAAAR